MFAVEVKHGFGCGNRQHGSAGNGVGYHDDFQLHYTGQPDWLSEVFQSIEREAHTAANIFDAAYSIAEGIGHGNRFDKRQNLQRHLPLPRTKEPLAAYTSGSASNRRADVNEHGYQILEGAA